MLVIDIETIPDERWRERVTAGVSPVGEPSASAKTRDGKALSIKDPEEHADRLAQWTVEKEEERLAKIETSYRKCSLDWHQCQIVCVAWGDGKGILTDTIIMGESNVEAERDLVGGIIARFEMLPLLRPLVTFNGLGFDLPVLYTRADILGISYDQRIRQQLMRRYDTETHCDLMQEIACWQMDKRHGIDFYAFAYGVEVAPGIDGRNVYDAWLAEDYDAIIAHNREDVRVLTELYKKTLGRKEGAF